MMSGSFFLDLKWTNREKYSLYPNIFKKTLLPYQAFAFKYYDNSDNFNMHIIDFDIHCKFFTIVDSAPVIPRWEPLEQKSLNICWLLIPGFSFLFCVVLSMLCTYTRLMFFCWPKGFCFALVLLLSHPISLWTTDSQMPISKYDKKHQTDFSSIKANFIFLLQLYVHVSIQIPRLECAQFFWYGYG